AFRNLCAAAVLFSVVSLIHTIARGRGPTLAAASPTLRLRLVEAAEAVSDPITRADMLSIVVRTLTELTLVYARAVQVAVSASPDWVKKRAVARPDRANRPASIFLDLAPRGILPDWLAEWHDCARIGPLL